MHLTSGRKGELCIFLSALLWGLFPVITILTFSGTGPLYSAALSTLASAVFFAVLLTIRRQWSFVHERRAWKPILLTTLYIGIIFYGLVFTGLRYTNAGNGAIMSLMEVFFSFLILGLLIRHEQLVVRHLFGGICMVGGVGLILLPNVSGWHAGDLLILLATACAPLGNKYTQEARQTVTAEFVLFWRGLLSGLFLLALAYALEPLPARHVIVQSLSFFLVNGILLLGLSKILWIEGVHRIPITKAVSLEVIAPLFTLIVAFFVLHEKVTVLQMAGLLPIVAGVFLLTKKPKS